MSSFLYQDVYNGIIKKIADEEYKLNSLLPSEKRLCEIYHVSLITVRRALEQLVNDNIVEKVKGKGTVVKVSIRKTENNFDGNIGMLVINDANRSATSPYSLPPFDQLTYDQNLWIHTIYTALYEQLSNKYNVFLGGYTTDQILNHFDQTVFKDVQRIFLISTNKPITNFLLQKNKFLVTLNNFAPDIHNCSILSNDRKLVCQAVEHLISLGHKNIANLNGSFSYGASIERSMGFQEAFLKNNLPINFSLIKWGDMSSVSGYYLTKELFKEPQKPTAIFCANDNMAAGCILAIKELGLRCPEDVSVIGYDNNSEIQQLITPSLSTIDPLYKKIGEIAADKLTRDIWFDDITNVEGIFIPRESIAPPNI